MYPYEILFGMTLYDIFLASGVISALVIARLFAEYDKISAKLFNFILLTGCASIALGYFSAVLFQAFYNWLDGGVFELSASTGATFLGGLTGGVAVFLCVYFLIGRFVFPNRENVKYFPRLLDFAAVSITCAHGMGRIGCLMAGCCHGAETDAWYGIYHVALDSKVVPVQLFEAIFLFALCAILAVLAYKRIAGTMATYMFLYGLWRFFVEYIRTDNRGSTVVEFLTPSQLTSVILIVGSALIFVYTRVMDKRSKREEEVGNVGEE